MYIHPNEIKSIVLFLTRYIIHVVEKLLDTYKQETIYFYEINPIILL